MLKGKHILLGVTGSIAAYKAAILVRALVKEGAEVKVIMSEMAKQFITPLTMATLSKNPILVEFYNPENGDWNSHISLGLWADLYLIAPASANTIAKMSTGVADNLLLTTYLSARSPVVVAPAMDVDMFLHTATQKNIQIIRDRGVYIIEPGSGELASGLEGKGRMEEPEAIVEFVKNLLERESPANHMVAGELMSAIKGKKVLLTAGPTVEQIDPVRFISNNSTGKMGYSIAEEFAKRGAIVTLISGPVNERLSSSKIRLNNVNSAEEMYTQTVAAYRAGADIVILAAAVSDFTPSLIERAKIKRLGDEITLKLKPTRDIAASLGEVKKEGAIHIGFALETDNEFENALSKLQRKNLDAIVLNSLNDKGAGFGKETNKITIISSNGESLQYPLKDKKEVASDIVDYVENMLVC
ncbi:MAG: bifunctional phosphopantothenoylcysteine decarboxylase/phosphopantothenate--cysteine ligase CoaBC [Bacteroidetes bacterium HGW-Bacteroidetes-8]|jgi:phosphopantothenoylcysteine decarboxylase/phosphopantothenate--cysteine ligase|nr:MAG: bifunctional phosphopantothenoylcysteine decarboxylase/phosphopantothenate--cysteine ligase CoaBC [Bacteroidetes bacterium HGW-Bacteroidetes-8]